MVPCRAEERDAIGRGERAVGHRLQHQTLGPGALADPVALARVVHRVRIRDHGIEFIEDQVLASQRHDALNRRDRTVDAYVGVAAPRVVADEELIRHDVGPQIC